MISGELTVDHYCLNQDRHGVEIYFDEKPDGGILQAMKGTGWRWHNVKKCWYNNATEKNISFAKSLCHQTEAVAASENNCQQPEKGTPYIDPTSPNDDIDAIFEEILLDINHWADEILRAEQESICADEYDCAADVIEDEPTDYEENRVAENYDELTYNNESENIRLQINCKKFSWHRKLLGLRIGDSFLDGNGRRCVVKKIKKNDIYAGWRDLAPRLATDSYPNSYKRRKWDRSW